MAKSFNARMQDRFRKITSDYKKINEYVHETAMMILKHANEHGDCSTAQGLVMAMPASARREMLIMWFAKYSPIVVKNDEKHKAGMLKEGVNKNYVPFDITGAGAEPFYVLAEDHKERAPLDFEALIKMIENGPKRLERMIEKDQVPTELVDSVKDVIHQLKGVKVKKIKPANTNTNTDQADASAVLNAA